MLSLAPTIEEGAFEREDEAVEVSAKEEKIYVPQRERENQALIDDEYCDIVFDEEGFSPLNDSPLAKNRLRQLYRWRRAGRLF